jgi:hypothetical protein
LIVQLVPYIGWELEFLPGDLGDTRFNLFVLEHGKQFLFGEVGDYWNAGFMYPEPEVISLSDNLLGTVPIYAFFRLLGASIFTSFQLWTLVLAVLNYSSAFLLFQKLLKNPLAAALGAYVFAFSVGLAAQMNHAQMYPRFAIPLSLLFLMFWFEKKTWRYFMLSLSCVVYQFYCGIYLGFMLVIPYAAVAIYSGWKERKALVAAVQPPRQMMLYVLAVAVNVVCLLILFLPYLRRAKTSALYDFSQIVGSLPSPMSYVSASPGTLAHEYLVNTTTHYPAFWDHWIFPGWLTLGAFVFVSLRIFIKPTHFWWSPTNRSFVIAGVITWFLFLRWGEVSLYYFAQLLPGFSAMRSLTRIINVELLFFGLSVGILIVLLVQKTTTKWRPFAFLFFLSLLVMDNYVYPESVLRTSRALFVERHNAMTVKLEHLSEGTVISYEPKEIDDPIAHVQLDVMLAAQSLRLKSVNGYSGSAPLKFHKYWEQPNEENRLYYFERFDSTELKNVVVIE